MTACDTLWVMPKRSRKPPADPNKAAHSILAQIIGGDDGSGKDPLAVALGRRGGLKGGPARTKALTPAQRKASAKRAAEARWQAHRKRKDKS